MKQFALAVLLFASTHAIGQTKEVIISKESIGSISCKYALSINMDKGDTLRYIYIGFQNEKYSSITDIKSIAFHALKDSAGIIKFNKDLRAAVLEMGSKTEMSWSRDAYDLALFDFTDKLYVIEGKKGSGYTTLSKKQVFQLIDWLDKIGFKN